MPRDASELSISDIEQWLDNDEGLYRWRNQWVKENKGKGGTRGFIKENRDEIEAAINTVLHRKPSR